MRTANPVLAEVTRGSAVESLHRGTAAVVDAGGEVIAAWGDMDAPHYPRSAVKPLQAIPFVASGAADAFNLGNEEIAMSAASHMAGRRHVAVVRDWLSRLGLSEADLVCGAIEPGDREEAAALIKAGGKPTRVHNNCSGKHAGFLTTSLHAGLPTSAYADAKGEEQRTIRKLLSDFSDFDLGNVAPAADGCGIPTLPMPIAGLARACARMANPDGLTPDHGAAAKRIIAAMAAEPELVRGRGEFDTVAITAGNGAFVTKVGAEGVSAGIVPAKGIGIAVKIDDGGRRAADVVMANILDGIGVLDRDARNALAPWLAAPVSNTLGNRVGEVRPSVELKDGLAALAGQSGFRPD